MILLPSLSTAPECVSVTARPTSDILQPLAGSTTPQLSKVGVEIQSGESLCLSFVRSADRERVDTFGVVERGHPPLVAFQVMLTQLPDGTAAFSIENHTDDTVLVKLLSPLGASSYLIDHFVLDVAPHERKFQVLPTRVERLVLAGALLTPNVRQTSAASERRASGVERIDREGVDLGVGLSASYGVHTLAPDALARDLAANRHSQPSSTQAMFGGSVWFEFGRVRLDLAFYQGDTEIKSYRTGKPATLGFGGGSLDLGWELVRHRGFLLYPFVGAGSSSVSLDATDADPPVLPNIVPSPAQGRKVEAGGGQLGLGVALEQLLAPFHQSRAGYVGLTVGMKLGYHLQFSHSEWSGSGTSDDLSYHGGPPVNVGGFYGLFSVGLPLRVTGL